MKSEKKNQKPKGLTEKRVREIAREEAKNCIYEDYMAKIKLLAETDARDNRPK